MQIELLLILMQLFKASIFTHSNSTNPERVTVTAAGFYIINATIGYDNTGGNRISPRASIFKNGTEITETRTSSYSRGASYGDEKTLQELILYYNFPQVIIWKFMPGRIKQINQVLLIP